MPETTICVFPYQIWADGHRPTEMIQIECVILSHFLRQAEGVTAIHLRIQIFSWDLEGPRNCVLEAFYTQEQIQRSGFRFTSSFQGCDSSSLDSWQGRMVLNTLSRISCFLVSCEHVVVESPSQWCSAYMRVMTQDAGSQGKDDPHLGKDYIRASVYLL